MDHESTCKDLVSPSGLSSFCCIGTYNFYHDASYIHSPFCCATSCVYITIMSNAFFGHVLRLFDSGLDIDRAAVNNLHVLPNHVFCVGCGVANLPFFIQRSEDVTVVRECPTEVCRFMSF